MKQLYKGLFLVFAFTFISYLSYAQSNKGSGGYSVDEMIRLFNSDNLDSACIVSDSLSEDASLADNSKYWFYRGLIFKEMFKRHDRSNPKSVYRSKAELALLKELDIEKDSNVIIGVKKNIGYLAATYYNDAVKLLDGDKPNAPLSVYTFDRFTTLVNRLNQGPVENEKRNKYMNALGSYYGNMFENDKGIDAGSYYELAKKCYESILAIDSNQTSAKYNLVVLETNYKSKKELLLKEESAKKDQVILNLNAVKKLADAQLLESQMIKDRQRDELKVLKSDREKHESDMKAVKADEERKDAIAQKDKQKENTIIWSMTIGLVIILAFSSLIFINSRTKEKLNKELNKLTAAVSKSTNSILIFNEKLELEWVNKNFLDIYSTSLEEYKKNNGKTLFDISRYSNIEPLVKECISKKTGMSYESVTDTSLGKRWYQSMLSPVFDESGKLQNILIIDSDITQLKNIEEEIRQKNKDMTDSIHYAQRIQRSILPDQKTINALIKESFILYNPKDILSGDFYWIGSNESKSKVIAAAIDCTGHGVPGALLTIMANDLLNTIILQKGHTNPKDILNEMNLAIIDLLAIENEDFSRDGMDMSVIEIEHQNDKFTVRYAGAYNPLYYFRDNQLNELAPVKFNIGSIPLEQKDSVICHTLEMKKDDVVYLFSDGYADQLSGRTGKKFMKGKFKELLQQIHKLPLAEQKNMLEETIKHWKGDTFQTDDILVMGFKF